MFKLGSSVFSVAIRPALLIACLPFLTGLPAVILLAQETPVLRKNQKSARNCDVTMSHRP
jgi:hypothetical protein